MFDRWLEGFDLTAAHTVLALLGAFLSVYVMQLTHYEAEDDVDPPALRFARRFALALMAWAMLWSLSYSETKNWQPWPAQVLTIMAADAILFIRAIAIKARIKRTGVKPDAPRAALEPKLPLPG